MDKTKSDGGCNAASENNRKRHCSATPLDESPKKKILFSEAPEVDKSSNLIKSGLKAASEEHDRHTNAGELQSLFFLGELCDEILYEIFKYLDTWSLMSLMNVCERFRTFVLDKRLWTNIDLSKEPLPLGILEDMLERSHEKTKCIKLRGPSTSQHIDREIDHFTKTIKISFALRCVKLVTLELYSVTLDFDQVYIQNFPRSLKRLVMNNCSVRVDYFKTLFAGIETILVNLEELAIENNSWFDPYYVMPLSKLPLLRYLSLRGCLQMGEFIPYGSISARHGFKKLEILDLRGTPLNDSDLQCFNVVETLKELYLQYPENPCVEAEATCPSGSQHGSISNNISRDLGEILIPATTNATPLDMDTPSTSSASRSSISGTNESRYEINEERPTTPISVSLNQGELASSPNNSTTNSPPSPSRVVTLVTSNLPPLSRHLPGPDHIFYLDVRNRPPHNAVHFNIRYHNSLRSGRQPAQPQQQNRQQSPPPVIEHMLHNNLFWDIVNPLGRVVGVGDPERVYGEENGVEYRVNLFSLSTAFANRQQSRGSISDRGVCCFGRTRQPVQQGVIWIRFNNRPSENRFERFSVRDYKHVTDVSLQHLAQCSPNLIYLDVSGTGVTLEGVQRFKDLKPECKVVAEHLLGTENRETLFS